MSVQATTAKKLVRAAPPAASRAEADLKAMYSARSAVDETKYSVHSRLIASPPPNFSFADSAAQTADIRKLSRSTARM